MAWSDIASSWQQVKGEAQATWGRLTDNDLKFVDGQRQILVGKLRAKYGLNTRQAEREIDAWAARMTALALAPSAGYVNRLGTTTARRASDYFDRNVRQTIKSRTATCLVATAAVAFVLGAIWNKAVR